MTRETNWPDNHTFGALAAHRPDSVDAVRRIVAGAARVHAIGARHSFNGAADSPGALIDLRGIDPAITIDRERRTVTASGGASYGAVAAHLHREGWALLNMASLPHITLAGATATGTHGSGDANGTLSSAVSALELVTASGDLVTVRRGEPGFDGLVVSLGAFGIATRVTLDIQPDFVMRQDAFADLPWAALRDGFDAVMSAGESVSVMTCWSVPAVARVWIKTRAADGAAVSDTAVRLGAVPTSAPLAEEIPGLTAFGEPAGPAHQRMPHFRPDVEPGKIGHLQSEYLLPRDRAGEAIALLRGIGERIDGALLVSEIRSMTADGLWLSPAYGRDTIGFHFSWRRDFDAVARVTAEIEALLLPLGGRPHWGKIIHAGAERLAPLYPRLSEFRALARDYDPGGKFANAFLRAHVLGDSPP